MIHMKMAGVLTALAFATACTTPSVQHTAASAGHSAQAASHGASAAASGAATVSAIPVLATGSVLAVTGAALEDIGTASLRIGEEVIDATSGVPAVACGVQAPQNKGAACVIPNGPPRLN